ncbi:hypothetical protein ACWEQ3_02215, partial [Streptomyces mirabilis]
DRVDEVRASSDAILIGAGMGASGSGMYGEPAQARQGAGRLGRVGVPGGGSLRGRPRALSSRP